MCLLIFQVLVLSTTILVSNEYWAMLVTKTSQHVLVELGLGSQLARDHLLPILQVGKRGQGVNESMSLVNAPGDVTKMLDLLPDSQVKCSLSKESS